MTYNKSEIMKRAWNNYKAALNTWKTNLSNLARRHGMNSAYVRTAASMKPVFAAFLKGAWATAKATARDTRTALEQIDSSIFFLTQKDRWTAADRELNRKLNEERRQLVSAIAAA